MPDLLGLTFDLSERTTVKTVAPKSQAEKDGFKSGDELTTLEGQAMISLADVQWVLEHAKDGSKLKAEVKRGGAAKSMSITLPPGWRRKGDFGWRDATWETFRPDMNGDDLKPDERQTLKLAETATGFRLTYVGPGAKGFQKEDIVVEVDGQRTGLASFSQFLAYIAQKKMPGDSIAVAVLRGGKEQKLQLTAK
jgi:S1-C subfamily serine protease